MTKEYLALKNEIARLKAKMEKPNNALLSMKRQETSSACPLGHGQVCERKI